MTYEPVIGLETHVQLGTKSKLFCACPTQFGEEPNKNTCPVCLGWPGSLPVLNEEALKFAIKVGLALHCEISGRLKFDRKNYFYPDLPKAYQISQYDQPVNKGGWLEIEIPACHSRESLPAGQAGGNPKHGSPISAEGRIRHLCGGKAFGDDKGEMIHKKIGITRAHLEEDAGKLLHEGIKEGSLVDYNRAGVPLLEIVSEPDLCSSDEAHEYLTALKAILQYLEVSECNMEKGELRCDANISIRKKGETTFGTKVEIKNMNSFKAVQKALQYEIERQGKALEAGERIVLETRLWDESKGQTFSMRSKEEAHDYRYFPEPDLVPFTISKETVDEIAGTLPELPGERAERLMKSFGLSEYDTFTLVEDKKLADYFETCTREGVNPKLVSNWIQSELLALLNAKKISVEDSPVKPRELAGLIRLIEDGTISGKMAKDVLSEMFATGKSAEAVVTEEGLVQVTDSKLIEEIAERIIKAHAKSVEDFRAGKKQALGFLVGQIMKETQGKANPKLVNEILEKKLK